MAPNSCKDCKFYQFMSDRCGNSESDQFYSVGPPVICKEYQSASCGDCDDCSCDDKCDTCDSDKCGDTDPRGDSLDRLFKSLTTDEINTGEWKIGRDPLYFSDLAKISSHTIEFVKIKNQVIKSKQAVKCAGASEGIVNTFDLLIDILDSYEYTADYFAWEDAREPAEE